MTTAFSISPNAGSAGDAGATPRARRNLVAASDWLKKLVLVSPAALVALVCLVVPLAMFMVRGISNAEIVSTLPVTIKALQSWNGMGLPGDDAFEALGLELSAASTKGQLGELARRMNFLQPGYRALIMGTGTRFRLDGSTALAQLIGLDERWGKSEVWQILRQESGRWTDSYFLAALDMKRNTQGEVVRVEESRRIFVALFIRTFSISVSVTLLCLALGYPAAWVLANASPRWVSVFLVMVLLPFWTSTLVRSTAWIVLLQNEGLVNRTLRWAGFIDGSLPLFANRFAVLVAMTHVLLPYMIMPLYGAMKAVPPELTRAAGSLGATPLRSFVRVYLPQTYSGVAAGSLLVFILALGYYITPALVGGPADQMVSYFIALYTNESLNWGLASALGTLLLAFTALFYLVFSRLAGVKLGARQ